MDAYWSIEHCAWVPCRGPVEPPATTWADAADGEAVQMTELPQQRSAEPVPAER